MNSFVYFFKSITIATLSLLTISCASLKPSEDLSKSIILGRYFEYILLIEDKNIASKANKFLSRDLYNYAKDELENEIDLTQRGSIQFTYIPLTNIKSYEFKTLGDIHCLKLNGTDINQRKLSLMLDFIFEDNLWKIGKVYAGYLDADKSPSYDDYAPCTQIASDGIFGE
ncbi:MAG: hypothetical protein KTR20_12520 [Cellvibrionaceae bacterium]|nr:hypothetical protein [Cellvibrionaceae bacterium]